MELSQNSPTASDRVAIALEHLRLANEELLKRIEMQMKLVELMGLLFAALYSAAFILDRYNLLLIVPLFSSIAVIWWADRQRVILFLRQFIVDQIEGKMLRQVLDGDDKRFAMGWQSFLSENYLKKLRTAHVLVFGTAILTASLPALLYCLGSLSLKFTWFLSTDTKFYNSLLAVEARKPELRVAAGSVILFSLSGFTYAAFLLKDARKRLQFSALGGVEGVATLLREMADTKKGLKTALEQLEDIRKRTELRINRLTDLETKMTEHTSLREQSEGTEPANPTSRPDNLSKDS